MPVPDRLQIPAAQMVAARLMKRLIAARGLPAVIDFVRAGDAIGVDLRAVGGAWVRHVPGFRPEQFELPDLSKLQRGRLPDEEIDDIYRELRALDREGVSLGDGVYRAKLSRLRALQADEADRLHAEFERRNPQPAIPLDEALLRARALIGEREDPSDPNRAR